MKKEFTEFLEGLDYLIYITLRSAVYFDELSGACTPEALFFNQVDPSFFLPQKARKGLKRQYKGQKRF